MEEIKDKVVEYDVRVYIIDKDVHTIKQYLKRLPRIIGCIRETGESDF